MEQSQAGVACTIDQRQIKNCFVLAPVPISNESAEDGKKINERIKEVCLFIGQGIGRLRKSGIVRRIIKLRNEKKRENRFHPIEAESLRSFIAYYIRYSRGKSWFAFSCHVPLIKRQC